MSANHHDDDSLQPRKLPKLGYFRPPVPEAGASCAVAVADAAARVVLAPLAARNAPTPPPPLPPLRLLSDASSTHDALDGLTPAPHAVDAVDGSLLDGRIARHPSPVTDEALARHMTMPPLGLTSVRVRLDIRAARHGQDVGVLLQYADGPSKPTSPMALLGETAMDFGC